MTHVAGRPITILHIIPTLGVGGAERQLAKLLPRMDAGRFRQTVCFYTKSRTLEAGLHAAGIPTIFFDKFSMPSWKFFSRLRGVVREVAPDVVHTWLYSANFWGRLAALTCLKRRIVSSDRATLEPDSLPVVLFERLMAPFTTRLVNSRAVAASLQQVYGLPASRTRVIYNAVDPPATVTGDPGLEIREELGLPRAQKLVLTVGRQAGTKNLPMLCRVARRVGARRPDFTFLHVGHIFDPGAMRALLEETGASPYMRVMGERDDIPRWLTAADLLCVTSNVEGVPNAILESMTHGLPVVSSEFPGAREVIPDDRVGLVLPLEDDRAMAEAVEALLDDPSRRRTLAEAARRHVREAFGWERLVREMESFYEGLVDRGARAPGG